MKMGQISLSKLQEERKEKLKQDIILTMTYRKIQELYMMKTVEKLQKKTFKTVLMMSF